MAEGVIAEIALFGGNFAPRNWAFCSGQILPINQNQSLFSLLGTTYGGDGRTSFGIPDLRSRVPIGVGNAPGLSSRTLGARLGTETVTLTENEMPAHSHSADSGNLTVELRGNAGMGDSSTPGPGKVLAEVMNVNAYSSSDANLTPIGGIGGTPLNTTVSNSGGNQSHNNRQPLLGLNYIICLRGIYPSRN